MKQETLIAMLGIPVVYGGEDVKAFSTLKCGLSNISDSFSEETIGLLRWISITLAMAAAACATVRLVKAIAPVGCRGQGPCRCRDRSGS